MEIVKGEWEGKRKEEGEGEKLSRLRKPHSPQERRHRVHWKSTKQRREGEL